MKKIVKYILGFGSTLALAMSLASCGKTELKDYAGQLKLTEEYEGRNFITEGIGAESLIYCFDGDTIKTASGTIRFLAVDTPESTGNVDKWGKSASFFTKGKLKEAEKIVLESSNVGSHAAQENNGRYLAFVWYIPKGGTEFRNLNLELVQEGFSEFQQTDKYTNYFEAAANQALKAKLRIHGDDEDPNYTNEILETDLKYVKEQLTTDPTNILGTKVGIEAYVTSDLPGNKYNIRQVIDGVNYDFDLYTGYKGGEYNAIGNKVRFVGYIQEFPEASEQFQLSGLIVANTNPEGTYTKVLQHGYFVQVGSSILSSRLVHTDTLYDDLTVSEVNLDGENLTIKGSAKRRGLEDFGVPADTEITISVKLAAGETNNIKVGDKISFTGFSTKDVKHTTRSFEVNVSKLSDITLV